MAAFRNIFFSLLVILPAISYSQNMEYARKVIDTLSHASMHGRGYVNDGEKIAANYIREQFKKVGLKPFLLQGRENYFQKYSLSVNTFPGDLEIKIDGKLYKAGEDYIPDPSSGSVNEKIFGTIVLEKKHVTDKGEFKQVKKLPLSSKAIIIDKSKFNDEGEYPYLEDFLKNKVGAGLIIFIEDELVWGVGRNQYNYPAIIFRRESWPENGKIVIADIDSKMIPSYETQNVIGYIPGKTNPDSFIVITAHYDHLGRMGRWKYIPGANDNASGVAMMLNLAEHYGTKINQPDYSIAFIAFGAEEAGLVGSMYYTTYPAFKLNHIKVLLNIDLMGNGPDGIMVVNGKVFPRYYNRVVKINNENNFLKEVKARGKAANSDHYFFSEKGVTAYFFYLMGDYPNYHDIYDTSKNLPMVGYEGAYNLFTTFINSFSR